MAKITAESREEFNQKIAPYTDIIKKSQEKEKSILALVAKDTSGIAYKKLLLSEEMMYQATVQITINNLSETIMDGTKNNDALNEARKALYKSIIYLEEIVTNIVDAPFSEYEPHLAEISNTPLEKRYLLTRKLGLAIRLLMDAYGENTKWKWTFVDIQARFAVVAKNMLDMKQTGRIYFDPRDPDYDNTVLYARLILRLLDQSATGYRDKYELSTHRIDDMRLAIQFLVALRRLQIILGNKDEAEEIKKKAMVWKDKLDADTKSGVAK